VCIKFNMKSLILFLFIVASSAHDGRTSVAAIIKAARLQKSAGLPQELMALLNNIDIQCVIRKAGLTDPGNITEAEIDQIDKDDVLLDNADSLIDEYASDCPVDSMKAPEIVFDSFAGLLALDVSDPEVSLCFQYQLKKINELSPMMEFYNEYLMEMSQEECDNFARTNKTVSKLLLKQLKPPKVLCIDEYPLNIKYELVILAYGEPSKDATAKLKVEYMKYVDEAIEKCREDVQPSTVATVLFGKNIRKNNDLHQNNK
jgi:hypothetical protein